MRKRIIALILTIGLLLSCLQITTIAADAAVVVAEDCSVTQGGYAYVYLRAKNFVNVAALDIAIYYDSSAMSIDYTSNSSFLNSSGESLFPLDVIIAFILLPLSSFETSKYF